jgi:hypothetical protein
MDDATPDRAAIATGLRDLRESWTRARPPVAMAFALGALAMGNLLFDVGLFWLAGEDPRGWRIIFQAGIAIFFSQPILLGIWLGLGDGRWYLRLAAGIALTLGLAQTITLGMALSATARKQHELNPAAMIAFVMIAMLLATSVAVIPLRRIRNWRLTWEQLVCLPATRQFQLGDLLLWMIPISGTLAVLRFLWSTDDNFAGQFGEFTLVTAGMAAIVLASMMAAFARRSL